VGFAIGREGGRLGITYADDKLVRGAEILELYVEAAWTLLGGRPPDGVEESVRNATVFVTAREGAKLVGFISVLSDRAYYAHITEFLVRPRFRARGIEGELLRRVLESLGREVVISIFAEPDAESFYRRHGFVPTAGGMMLRRS